MILPSLHLRDLAAVEAVASHGHFGKAARALTIAQPTLSAQVKRVEEALGITLFERTDRSFLVTPQGQAALARIREVLLAAQRLAEHTRHATLTGPLRVGIIPTLGPYYAPHFLPLLCREGVQISLSEAPTASLLDALHEGDLDVAILSLPLATDAYLSLPLFDEPFLLLAHTDDLVLDKHPLQPRHLRVSDLVLLGDGHCLRDQALSVCGSRAGEAPRMVATSLETLKYLVASGTGVTLLPALAASLPESLHPLVRVRAFDERTPSRRVALCVRPTSPALPRAQALARLLRSHLPEGVQAVAAGDAHL